MQSQLAGGRYRIKFLTATYVPSILVPKAVPVGRQAGATYPSVLIARKQSQLAGRGYLSECLNARGSPSWQYWLIVY